MLNSSSRHHAEAQQRKQLINARAD